MSGTRGSRYATASTMPRNTADTGQEPCFARPCRLGPTSLSGVNGERRLGARQVPRSAELPRQHSVILGNAHLQKVAGPRSGPAPLHPEAHSHPAANPLINLRNRPVVLADPKVPHPTPKVAAQLRQATTHRHAPITIRQSPDFSPETRRSLLGPADLGSLKGNAKERKLVRRNSLSRGLELAVDQDAGARKYLSISRSRHWSGTWRPNRVEKMAA